MAKLQPAPITKYPRDEPATPPVIEGELAEPCILAYVEFTNPVVLPIKLLEPIFGEVRPIVAAEIVPEAIFAYQYSRCVDGVPMDAKVVLSGEPPQPVLKASTWI